MKLEWERPEPHIWRTECGRFLTQADLRGKEWELFRKMASGDVISLGIYKEVDQAKQAAAHNLNGYYRTQFRSVNMRQDYVEVYLQHELRLFEFRIYGDKIQCKMFCRSDARNTSSGSLEGTWEECQGSLINMADKLLQLVPTRNERRTRYGKKGTPRKRRSVRRLVEKH